MGEFQDKMSIQPTIIIDTREQTPWAFENLPTEREALDSADYSIRGLEHLVAVERKSLDDLLACVGRERDRFKRELQRLRGYRFRCLIIEASNWELENGDWRSKVLPSHVLGSLAAWQCQYELPIWLAGRRDAAGQFCERYLYQCARQIHKENQAVGAMEECLT